GAGPLAARERHHKGVRALEEGLCTQGGEGRRQGTSHRVLGRRLLRLRVLSVDLVGREGGEPVGEFTTLLRPVQDGPVERARKVDLMCRGLSRQVQAWAGRWRVLTPVCVMHARSGRY